MPLASPVPSSRMPPDTRRSVTLLATVAAVLQLLGLVCATVGLAVWHGTEGLLVGVGLSMLYVGREADRAV